MERIRVFWSRLKPLPNPTSRITDVMPQMIPNMVRKLRSLCAEMEPIVCLSTSRKFMDLRVVRLGKPRRTRLVTSDLSGD